MTWTWRKKLLVSIPAMLLLVIAAGAQMLRGATSDRYAGQPQVVGLPPGYDALAAADPYEGVHPSRKDRSLGFGKHMLMTTISNLQQQVDQPVDTEILDDFYQ